MRVLEEVEEEIANLSIDDRFTLVERTIQKLFEATPTATEELWLCEAHAREKALSENRIAAIPWEKAKMAARKLL